MGMAVDWIGKNLYWTDVGYNNAIFVAKLDNPEKRALLISGGLLHPRSIAVDPINGFLFWTDWPLGGESNGGGNPLAESEAKIEMSGLDGSDRKIVIQKDVVWPSSLTIDYNSKRIYWCDSFLKRIESISLHHVRKGTESLDRILHLSNEVNPVLSRPYGLAIHKSVIFWSEFDKGHIMRLNLKSNRTDKIVDENPLLFALKVFAKELQPEDENHACYTDNKNRCADLCLLTPSGGHTCRCRDGYNMTQGGFDCEPIPGWVSPSRCRSDHFQCRTNQLCIDELYT